MREEKNPERIRKVNFLKRIQKKRGTCKQPEYPTIEEFLLVLVQLAGHSLNHLLGCLCCRPLGVGCEENFYPSSISQLLYLSINGFISSSPESLDSYAMLGQASESLDLDGKDLTRHFAPLALEIKRIGAFQRNVMTQVLLPIQP